MLSTVRSAAPVAFESRLIEVECDLSNSLPGFHIVGLPDKSIEESRERVRGAIKNSGLKVPPKRIILNLAPADLPKDGPSFDLAMAVAVLAASGQIPTPADDSLFAGELSLDGRVRPIMAAITCMELARSYGLKRVYLPAENAQEAAAAGGAQVYAIRNLSELIQHLKNEFTLSPANFTPNRCDDAIFATDLAEISGQTQAKRALEIAAAGGHNLLLAGPPGAGKTLLCRALSDLLPPPSQREQIEITKLHALAGVHLGGLISTRPFRSPHHSASAASLIGSARRPGEITLAHNGILFLDELAEFNRAALEALRQPLEDGFVTVTRSRLRYRLPSSFMLAATANPCPCGYLNDQKHPCSCSAAAVSRYKQKLSGPLIDRIDLFVRVERVKADEMMAPAAAESSRSVAARVAAARRVQTERFDQERLNAQMTLQDMGRFCRLGPAAAALAAQAMERLGLSGRGYHRALKIARTVADLASSPDIETPHLAEALAYRPTA